MMKTIYKLYFALRNNKLLDMCRLFLISYDIKKKLYVIWYLDANGIPKFYDSCRNGETARFKWDILMSRGTL